MPGYALFWMLAGIVAFVAICVLLHDLGRFNKRIIWEVADYLRPQDERTERELFAPETEAALREQRAYLNFRRDQLARFDLATERLGCRRHNIVKLLEWICTEWRFIRRHHTEDEYTPEQLEWLNTVRRQAITFRRLALLAIVLCWGAKVLLQVDRRGWLPTPSLAALLRMLNVDLLDLYREIRMSAGQFALRYGEDMSRELVSRL